MGVVGIPEKAAGARAYKLRRLCVGFIFSCSSGFPHFAEGVDIQPMRAGLDSHT